MATETEIGWTDHTFNPWWGCTKIAPGCTNCYAAALANRTGRSEWGPQGTRVVTSPANWKLPLKWNRLAESEGRRHRVFCASMADVFEDWDGPITDHRKLGDLLVNADGGRWPSGYPSLMPNADDWGCRELTMDDLRRDLFALIDQTPHLDWQLLTKRPENVRRMCPDKKCRRNVWLGTSISDQPTADELTWKLVDNRDLCAALFISAEPLIGAINMRKGIYSWGVRDPLGTTLEGIDWLIVGGESGPRRRSMEVPWLTSLVDQCRAASVPCFVKQDAAAKSGQQGRIPDEYWSVKEFPNI